MKKLTQLAVLILCIVPFISLKADETIVVIVNSDNDQALTEQDVKNVYSDRIITWDDGNLINVYNLPVTATARKVFAREVLGLSAREHATAENNRKITNTIKNPSKTKRERLVITVVSRDKHAIGYVTKTALKEVGRVRVLFELQ